jgi:hypothetical protein
VSSPTSRNDTHPCLRGQGPGNTDALPCLVPSTSATRRLRIFVSSPSDVVDERNQYAAVVQELNLTLGALLPERAVVLELVRWETHTHPDLVAEPQRVVDEQIEADYDIFFLPNSRAKVRINSDRSTCSAPSWSRWA